MGIDCYALMYKGGSLGAAVMLDASYVFSPVFGHETRQPYSLDDAIGMIGRLPAVPGNEEYHELWKRRAMEVWKIAAKHGFDGFGIGDDDIVYFRDLDAGEFREFRDWNVRRLARRNILT